MRHIKPRRWIPIWGIGVVVTTAITAATMTGSCVFDTRTNFCEQFGLRCKEGQECAAHEAVCIDIGGCGNGIVDRDKGEICDDGNIEDGEVTNGVFVPDSCSHDCMSNQTCGNNQIDMGETCDDGDRNGLPDDGCGSNCQLKSKFCGNGVVDINMIDMSLSEQCDPGNMDSAGCNSNQANDPDHLFNPDLKVGCKFSRCGDGYTNAAAGEKCDSSSQITEDCNGPLCTLPFCGDNFTNTAVKEDCDNGGTNTSGCNGNNNGMQGTGSCEFPSCGDGYTNMKFVPPGSTKGEMCDTQGDSQDCNGNSSGSGSANNLDVQCQVPQCGDGYVNTMFRPKGAKDNETENCDNQDGINTSGCNGNNNGSNGPGSCRTPLCGDGYMNSAYTQPRPMAKAEQCDTGSNSQTCNGNDNDTDTAQGLGDCQMPSCGDGYVNTAFTPPGMPPNLPPGFKLTEECDNLGGIDTSGCNGNNGDHNGPGSCRMPLCGDGYVNPNFKPDGTHPEQCDPGDLAHNIPGVDCKQGAICTSSCICI